MASKKCETCAYRNKTEYEKPCIVYKGENCELYEKRGDGMTREEAIKILKEIEYTVNGDNKEYRDMAFNMAIKALDNIGHLTDRPCDVCEFHTDGCSQWKCIFCDELFGGMRR